MLPKVALLLLLGKCASAAKILALMTVASHSHHLWNAKYLEALAERGHRVTYFGLDEYKNRPDNISHIKVEGAYEEIYNDLDFSEISDDGVYSNTYMLHQWDDQLSAYVVESEALRELNRLIRKEKFDLVVHDVGASAFLLGAVDVLGRPPVVGITAFGIPTWALEFLGNPVAYSTKPHFFTPYSDHMTFFQRANNYCLHLVAFFVRWLSYRNQNEFSKKSFGQDVRELDRILDDINIIMVNSNYAIDYPFPKVPGLIPIGGLHIREPKPLPQDLMSYLDEAKAGVVYFSLGSNIRSSLLKTEKVQILVEAFKRLAPVRVLWKWETDTLPNKPGNVKIGKWFPQNDILAHPNVRLFFTHAGLLSTQEAVYHEKPIVGMPFFLDQCVNVKKCRERGLGEALDYSSLTVDKVVATIRKVLDDPRYKERARNASLVFRDEFGSPRERAVFWTEYAIRHGGAPHLRHAARDLAWYQNWMVDVLALPILLAALAVCLAAGRRSRGRTAAGRPKQKRN